MANINKLLYGNKSYQFGVKKEKRTLGIRDKQILYRNANKRCENPACKKEIDFDEMQTGHKTAYSKNGKTTLKNSVCLCYRCNKLQGTDSWETFLRKQGIKLKKKLKYTSVKPKNKKSQSSGLFENIKIKQPNIRDLF